MPGIRGIGPPQLGQLLCQSLKFVWHQPQVIILMRNVTSQYRRKAEFWPSSMRRDTFGRGSRDRPQWSQKTHLTMVFEEAATVRKTAWLSRAFKHERTDEVNAALLHENIHVMNHAGRIRIAVHGYNTREDVVNLLRVLDTMLRTA